jgi:hypothetical protein
VQYVCKKKEMAIITIYQSMNYGDDSADIRTEQEIKRLSGCLQIQIIFVYLHQERDNCL